MPAKSMTDTSDAPAYMTVSAHIRQLGMSRGRFYQLVGDGFFLPPIFLRSNKRPAYTADIAQKNMLAKTMGIGINGQPRVFNSRRQDNEQTNVQARSPRRSNGRQRRSNDQLGHVVASLRSLGIEAASEDQVAWIIADLFPQGTQNCDESEVIRAVFRHLRRSGTA